MQIENQVEYNNRVLQDLKNRSVLGSLFYFPLFLTIVGPDGFYDRHARYCLLFGILIVAVCLVRIIYVTVVSKWVKKYSPLWENILFFITVGATGLSWGAFFAWVMILRGEYAAKMLILVCSAGIAAGGALAFVPSLTLAISYVLTVLAPTSTLMFIYHTNQYLAVLILIYYSAFIAYITREGNQEYRQAFINEQLLIKKTEELSLLARVDALTGLFNRRYFDENINREWKKTSRIRMPLIVLIGDIDHFKKINDQYGHLAGDQFLKLTAGLFKTVFRRETDMVARFGGEEFIVLLTDSEPELAFALAEKMRKRLSEMQIVWNGVSISATLSLGMACAVPGMSETREDLISRADKALYRAKEQGRNQTVVASPESPAHNCTS